MLNKKALAATAAADKLYVEDVFSTYLYSGTGTTQSISNGIDLSGEGGMVWIKCRNSPDGNTPAHGINDTVRGTSNSATLCTNSTGAAGESFIGTINFSSFNTDGFTITNSNYRSNSTLGTYASWTFRKAEKFFDVVTYTGNGTAGQTISHNLGSVPGCIIIKRTDATGNWAVYHRSADATIPEQKYLYLNTTGAVADAPVFNDYAPTSTNFQVGSYDFVNANGGTFVAYLFAHDAGGFGDSGSESVIKCGSYTIDGSGNATVDLGWEPQWMVYKRTDSTSNWILFDNMRGFNAVSSTGLCPNLSNSENPGYSTKVNATGFSVSGGTSGATYIYIAIRRGPMKTPEAGTQVFSPNISTSAEGTVITTGFPIDSQLMSSRSSSGHYFADRIRGVSTVNSSPYVTRLLTTNSTTSESSANQFTRGWNNTSFQTSIEYDSISAVYWNFRRAPGFFDIVCYTGTGATQTLTHNLGVTPELVIIKSRSGTFNWTVLYPPGGYTSGNMNVFLTLNANTANNGPTTVNGGTTYTSTTFTVSSNNVVGASGGNYVAYLFASVTGVSKVGSYTGNGSSQTINCGFTGGARFVLIKATSTTGDWLVADSARGIVAGNDPYLELNTTNAEVTGEDWLDTDNTGFVVNEVSGSNANTNGVSYIYLAIA